MLMNMQIIIIIELMVLHIIGSSEVLQNGKLRKNCFQRMIKSA